MALRKHLVGFLDKGFYKKIEESEVGETIAFLIDNAVVLVERGGPEALLTMKTSISWKAMAPIHAARLREAYEAGEMFTDWKESN